MYAIYQGVVGRALSSHRIVLNHELYMDPGLMFSCIGSLTSLILDKVDFATG